MGQKQSRLKRTVTLFDTMRDAVGEEVAPLVKYLQDKRDISEFQIAKNINAEVNWVRQMLYKLQSKNLVTYFRKKDQIKGWYISYWTLNAPGAQYLASKNEKSKLAELKERLAYEEKYQGQLYLCPDFCVRLLFSEAAETNFGCSECGKLLFLQDNNRTIQQLKERIQTLEKKA